MVVQEFAACKPEPVERFNLAIAYDGVVARNRIIPICDSIVRKLWSDFELKLTWWKFCFLADPHIEQAARSALEEADAVLVAAHGAAPLPTAVRQWLEQGLAVRKNREGGLLAWAGIPTREGANPKTPAYLVHLASQLKMDFLPVEPEFSISPANVGHASAPPIRLPEAAPHWGINE